MNHEQCGESRIRCPAEQARRTISTLDEKTHLSHIADKTGLRFETGTAGTFMPRRQVTTIG
jgi:hypothetical protein